MEIYKGIPKSKRRKTTHIIDDDEVAPSTNNVAPSISNVGPSTSTVEEPILYQAPNVPLSSDALQQLLATIMKEKSAAPGQNEVDFNQILAGGNGRSDEPPPSLEQNANITLDEDSSSDEEDLGKTFDAARAFFPTEKEVKHAEILSVSALELNKTYFILSGKKSQGTYYDEDGNAHKGDNLIIKCVHIESNNVDERLTVRLSGVPYKILMEDSQYETYCESDEYYIKYVGTRDSKKNGHEYNCIKVLHREKGKKHWRIDGQSLKFRQELM